ncbi:cation:proton antiporter [Selenihalanaerobacter shriftii]|uniref:Sodium/proton antiporter, CPA1 family n=1 Tax=Selenihalanaerobacter shriftii TaxID=142842 RepID=A0A1T4JM07_9FIRM|nr:cation:proton antiporter [Selenihalanaerobacter shriftii]SJZ31219.1 sodium/proton antiporter, CPA1 family [Selenihalanaerobacter shriftii]
MLFSIASILIVGLILGFLFEQLNLPSLLGMLLAGVLLGRSGFNLLDKNLLSISEEIRKLALIIILLRAGLGISKEILKKIGNTAFKLSLIPVMFEGVTILFLAIYILEFSWVEAGLLAFIIAAVSPAVVVPSMLKLKEERLGEEKEIPTLILASASIDDVLAITFFSIFLGVFEGGSLSVVSAIAQIPIKVIGGIVLGLIIGYLLIKFYNRYSNLDLTYQTVILFAIAIFTTVLGDYLKVASLLAVMTIGYLLLEENKKLANEFSGVLNKLWIPAKVFLFVLIGAAVQIDVAYQVSKVGILIIIIGLIARIFGVLISTIKSNLNFSERIFCAIAYLPKATVQAAIGAVPLAAGVPNGELILALAVMSIMLTAPLGAIGIDYFAPKLLKNKI